MSLVDDTIAEAAQEILEGPFDDCPYCEGAGTHLKDELDANLRNRRTAVVCSICDGSGKRLRERYRWACGLLGYKEELNRSINKLYNASENAKKALKRKADFQRLAQIQNETKTKNRGPTIEEIYARSVGNRNFYSPRNNKA